MTDEQMYHRLSLMDNATISTIMTMICEGGYLPDISQETSVPLGLVEAVLEKIYQDDFDAACEGRA
jgi:hypothetical protein